MSGPSPPQTPTPSRSRATSPTSPTSYGPSVHSPLGNRSGGPTLHARSMSVAPALGASHRSATPAAPTQRSHTPGAGLLRSESARPSTPSSRTRRTSASTGGVTSPQKSHRSMSNESSSDEIQNQKDKERERQEKDAKRVQLIQRWIPNLESTSPPTGRFGFLHHPSPSTTTGSSRSRTPSGNSAIPPPMQRYRTPLSVNSP